MHDLVSLLRPRECDGSHQSEALALPVSGTLAIHMLRPKTHRAMVAIAAIAERWNASAATRADESRVFGVSRQGPVSAPHEWKWWERGSVCSFAKDSGLALREAHSPRASVARDYCRFLLHRGLLDPRIRTSTGFRR